MCVDVSDAKGRSRVIDLDIDIGADAVDYKYVSVIDISRGAADISNTSSAIANQESLSGLETEMRKIEGIIKEIVDEMEYLRVREERFSDTNRTCSCSFSRNHIPPCTPCQFPSPSSIVTASYTHTHPPSRCD